MPAIEGRFDNDTAINTFKVSNVATSSIFNNFARYAHAARQYFAVNFHIISQQKLINPFFLIIKMDGVPQQLMVYFNLGKPGISCLCDPSTFDKNDNSETIHGYDIDMENIKKITFSEM